MDEQLIARITFDDDQLSGRPCIRNMRFGVHHVLGLLAGGMTPEEISALYARLARGSDRGSGIGLALIEMVAGDFPEADRILTEVIASDLEGKAEAQAVLAMCKVLEKQQAEARRLAEDPITLEQLSEEFGVSRERVRQIEVRAFEKLQKAMRAAAEERNLVDA